MIGIFTSKILGLANHVVAGLAQHLYQVKPN
jgi:hypothetical protein